MAIFHGSFFADSILTNVDVHVILPLPDSDDYAAGDLRGYGPGVRFQTLYLLHGAYGDGTDWLRNTRIECYAQRHRLAVVMASAANSFYLDQAQGPAFARFFEQELPDFAETVFPLSPRREDRFIAGLSMGGYGALRIALRHPDRYAAAAVFSGAYDLERVRDSLSAEHAAGRAVFGHLADGDRRELDVLELARRDLTDGRTLPRLFVSCGTEDFTLDMNRSLKAGLEALGVELTYEEHPGAHNWDYWETHIQRALDWMPLKGAYLTAGQA